MDQSLGRRLAALSLFPVSSPSHMFASRTRWNLARNPLSAAVEKRRASGAELLDLTESNPTRCGFDYDQAAILGALADARSLVYDPDPRGLLPAREAVCGYYRERASGAAPSFADHISPEQVFLATSTSEAYSWIFRLLCDPGDEVLVPVPSYPLFEFLAGLADIRLAPYHLIYDHGWQIDFHSLEHAITPRTRAILVVHPNNPTGSYVKGEELIALDVLSAARELAIIADEVFLDYAHDSVPRPSFVANHDLLTFTLSGLSKISCLPQMKLAWTVVSGPDSLRREALARLEVIADTSLSMNAPIQHAAAALLGQRTRMQAQLAARLLENLSALDHALRGHPACTRLQIEGGWYAVLRVPATRPDEELAVRLVEDCGVLLHPGHFYDFSADGYLVLSLITPAAAFATGVARVLEFVSR